MDGQQRNQRQQNEEYVNDNNTNDSNNDSINMAEDATYNMFDYFIFKRFSCACSNSVVIEPVEMDAAIKQIIHLLLQITNEQTNQI